MAKLSLQLRIMLQYRYFQVMPFRRIAMTVMLFIFTVCSISACSDSSRTIQTINADMLLGQIESGQPPFILDVRTPREFGLGHIPAAVNISHTYLEGRINEVISHKNDPVVVYCKVGARAEIAAGILLRAGFSNVKHLEGDMIGWFDASYPVEK